MAHIVYFITHSVMWKGWCVMDKANRVLTNSVNESQSHIVKSTRSSIAFVIVFWCLIGVFMCGMCCLLDAVDLTARINQFFGM